MVTSKRLQKLVHRHRFDSGYLMLPYAEFLAYGMRRKHLSNSSKTFGKHPTVRSLPSPLKNQRFSRGFSHIGPIALAFCAYPCTSMPAGAAPCRNHRLVRCLGPQKHFSESSSESPESSPNPRFYRENLLFCSGGAGFELVEFES
jgi:hypothetical protein